MEDLFERLIQENENNRLLFLKNCAAEVAGRSKLFDKILDMARLATESTADTITLKEFFDKHKIEPVTPKTLKGLITKLEQKRNETIAIHPIIIKKGLKAIKHLRKRNPPQKKK
jgi:succinate dehydrogenase/fumarate reductase-like Fe-S protein